MLEELVLLEDEVLLEDVFVLDEIFADDNFLLVDTVLEALLLLMTLAVKQQQHQVRYTTTSALWLKHELQGRTRILVTSAWLEIDDCLDSEPETQ